MKIQDISCAPMIAMADGTPGPLVIEARFGRSGDEPSGNARSDNAHIDEFVHTLAPEPIWPRVFPGL